MIIAVCDPKGIAIEAIKTILYHDKGLSDRISRIYEFWNMEQLLDASRDSSFDCIVFPNYCNSHNSVVCSLSCGYNRFPLVEHDPRYTLIVRDILYWETARSLWTQYLKAIPGKEEKVKRAIRGILADYEKEERDIIYLESKNHCVLVHLDGIRQTPEGSPSFYATLDEAEHEFASSAFLRIHKSYLINGDHGLNIYGTKAGSVCDFYPVSGNFNDALIDLLTVDAANNLYRIKMINHNLYLTPASNSSGAALTWENASNADNQIWQLCASQSSGGGSTGGSTTITMPVNANQNYSGNSSWIINYGCAVCCGVDLASWKKNKSYTISDFANYYDEANGYYWTGPDNFSCSDAISLASLNEAQTIEKIRSYVKNHIPVACHAVGSGSRQHWFVAYELTGESGGTWATAGIKVLDPYNSNSGSTEGRRVTILEAMQTSHVTLGVDRIRIPN